MQPEAITVPATAPVASGIGLTVPAMAPGPTRGKLPAGTVPLTAPAAGERLGLTVLGGPSPTTYGPAGALTQPSKALHALGTQNNLPPSELTALSAAQIREVTIPDTPEGIPLRG